MLTNCGSLRTVTSVGEAVCGGLLIRAMVAQEFAGGAFIMGFATLFAWQVGGFIRRNRPLAYTYESIPEKLLP